MPGPIEDRRCRAGALGHPLRRWLFPARVELDPLEPLRGAHVADLGAGIGYHVERLLERIGPTGRLYAVEPDPDHLTLLTERFGSDGRLVPLGRSANSVPEIPDAGVDRVLLSLVLCCVVDPGAVLDEGYRILAPGGRAVVTYPAWGIPTARRRRYRLTEERWARLVRRRPWLERSSERRFGVRRRVLEKPA